MERKSHPDRFEYPGGPPESPYDLTGYNLPDQFGVRVHPIPVPIEMPGPVVETIAVPPGEVHGNGSHGYLLTHTSNQAIVATNRLLKQGAKVRWIEEPITSDGKDWPAGTFVIHDANGNALTSLAQRTGSRLPRPRP